MTEHLRWSGRRTQARAWPTWLVWVFGLVSLGCAGCGESLPAPRYAQVTGLIPPNAPYVLIGAPTPGDAAGFDARIQRRLASYRDNVAVQHVARVFGEVLGADLLDVEAMRAAGLDPQGDFAVVGLGVWPAAMIKVADQGRLDAYLGRVRAKGSPSAVEVGGAAVETLKVGAARLSLAQAQGYLVAVFHREGVEGADLLAPVLRGDPAQALGRSLFFEVVLGSVGESHGVLAVVNTRALDEAMLARVQPTDDPLRSHLSPTRLAVYDAERGRALKACRDGGRYVADRVPFVALGSTLDDDGHWRQRLLIRLDPVAEAGLRAVMPGLRVPLGGFFEGALAAFALSVDIQALARRATFAPALTLCPNLAMLTGAAGVLGRSLAETDADRVFGAAALGALYGFDLKPGFMTRRSAALLFEVKQPEVALEGFDIFLTGLGFQPVEGVTPGGGGRAYVVLGALMVSVIPFERHVGLILGEVSTEQVEAVTGQPPGAPSEEVGRLEVRGEPLQAMLRGLIDQLALLTPVNATYGRALLDAVEGIHSLSVTGRIEPEALMIHIDSQVQLGP